MTQLTIFDMLPPRPRHVFSDENPHPFLDVRPGDYAVMHIHDLPGIGYVRYSRIKVLAVDGDSVHGVFTNPWADHYLDGMEVTVSKMDIREQPGYYVNSDKR